MIGYPENEHFVLVEPNVVPVTEPNVLLRLEQIIRTAYKSEDKICPGSAERIVKAVLDRKHLSCIEHIYIKLKIKAACMTVNDMIIMNPFLFKHDTESFVVVGNLRAFKDYINKMPVTVGRELSNTLHTEFPDIFESFDITPMNFFEYVGEYEYYSSYRIITDRGISHEAVRHRNDCSYTQESTRYCDYGKKGIQICLPDPFDWSPSNNEMTENDAAILKVWEQHMEACSIAYKNMLKLGATPQMARSVLPNSLKTELVMTATRDAFRHFIGLRSAKDAHPQIQIISNMIAKFEEDKYKVPTT